MDPASSEEHGDRRLMNLFPIKKRLESSISLSLKNEKNVEDLVKVRRSEKETSNLRELISKNLFCSFCLSGDVGFIGFRRQDQEEREEREEYRSKRKTLIL